jgi:hypothetical protein
LSRLKQTSDSEEFFRALASSITYIGGGSDYAVRVRTNVEALRADRYEDCYGVSYRLSTGRVSERVVEMEDSLKFLDEVWIDREEKVDEKEMALDALYGVNMKIRDMFYNPAFVVPKSFRDNHFISREIDEDNLMLTIFPRE